MYQELVVSVIGASVIGDKDWLFLKHLILLIKSAFFYPLIFPLNLPLGLDLLNR